MNTQRGFTSLADLGYEWFLNKVLSLTNIDLTNYKRPQMERRINHLMTRNNVKTYHDFFRLIENNKEKLEEFTDWVTINVSEFFRDSDRYEILANKILPYLLSRFRQLKIWSAGCSNGAEPYSISILLKEMRCFSYSILATDIDDNAIIRATKGRYKKNDIKNVPLELQKKYFKRDINEKDEEVFTISPQIKNNVLIKKQDLLKDEFETGFNLIICRNVVIYFTAETKDILYNKFIESLVPGGIFFVGSTESLLNCKSFNLERVDIAFYKKL
jgi:chemotaxis protein methyltransferase CheR